MRSLALPEIASWLSNSRLKPSDRPDFLPKSTYPGFFFILSNKNYGLQRQREPKKWIMKHQEKVRLSLPSISSSKTLKRWSKIDHFSTISASFLPHSSPIFQVRPPWRAPSSAGATEAATAMHETIPADKWCVTGADLNLFGENRGETEVEAMLSHDKLQNGGLEGDTFTAVITYMASWNHTNRDLIITQYIGN